MKRSQFNHKNLQGNDADLKTSLMEYGLAWIETKDEFLFYYQTLEYRFDFAVIPKDYDVFKEHDWVDWDAFNNFIGMNAEDLSLPQQITDLISYYGYENIFGTVHWEGLIYPQVISGGNARLVDICEDCGHFSAEEIADFAEYADGIQNIRVINKFYRCQDESHLWPINNKFNVTDRAIRKVRQMDCPVSGLEYCYALEGEISRLVNKE